MSKTKHPFSKEFLDGLIDGRSTPEDFFGPDGLFKQLQAALVERMLRAEMTDHLGYEPPRDHIGAMQRARAAIAVMAALAKPWKQRPGRFALRYPQ